MRLYDLLLNQLKDFYETWYEYHDTTVHLNFRPFNNTKMAAVKVSETGATLALLNVVFWNVLWQ